MAGLDVGTGGVRAVLLNEAGEVEGTCEASYALSLPRSGWAEQDPEDWWRAAFTALSRIAAVARTKGIAIQGIGLTGQMHGAVFVGREGQVLRPAIIWMDQRTSAEAEALQQKLANAGLLQVVSNVALPNFTATKILWVMRHEPAVWEQTKYVLLPKDFIRYRLTGETATDVSDASGTLMLDIARRKWSVAVVDLVGMRLDQLPAVFEGPEVTGILRVEIAREFGLGDRVVVVAGAGDQPAAAIAAGVERPGTAALSLGTSGVVLAPSPSQDGPLPHGLHLFCHAVPDTWFVMGVTQSAGGSFRWFRDTFGSGRSYDELSRLAGEAPAGSEGLLFAPYLAGERCPHADSGVAGAWLGLTVRHTFPHMARSVMEGISYSLRDVLEAMRDHIALPELMTASGGGAQSPVWRGITEAILGLPVKWIKEQGPAVGAAVLAGRTVFSHPAYAAAVEDIGSDGFSGPWRNVYQEGYANYRQLYRRITSEL